MSHLRETDLSYIKGQIQDGRFTIGFIRIYLTMVLLLSGFLVGLSYAVANASTVGWENLSTGWHIVYYIEAALFILQIFILLFIRARNNFNQKILIVSLVLYSYKVALDPILMMSMFLKDSNDFESYVPFLLFIVSGILLHFISLNRFINLYKKTKYQNSKFLSNSTNPIWLSILFCIITFTGLIMRNGMGDFYNIFGMFIITFMYFGLLIGVSEFLIAAYAIFRFPSFSVNPPVNQYYKKKKKKKR